MSRVLERERARVPVPVRYRSRALGRLPVTPPNWWLAHFSEGSQVGAHALGGLILGAGFGVHADHIYQKDGRRRHGWRPATLAILAVVGALLALVLWII